MRLWAEVKASSGDYFTVGYDNDPTQVEIHLEGTEATLDRDDFAEFLSAIQKMMESVRVHAAEAA